MANNTLDTRIVLCNDTTLNWGESTKVLLKGETGFEFLDNGTVKMKLGNGVDTWADLSYLTLTPDEIITAINNSVTAASHTHSNKTILDSIQVALTNALKTNYDAAYTHSTQAHAPSDAQANVIETVKVNGTALTPNSKAVDVIIPTKVSELTNDAGYKTTDTDTTYNLGASASAANGNVKINLTGSDSTIDSVTVKGSGSVSVTSDATGNISVIGTDTKYTHPNSGVTAGTYKSVTVDAQGHVTAGTNPTTLEGYGITDAYTKPATDQAIAAAIANADHLKREIVTTLPTVANSDEHTIYMIKDASVSGSDKYKEYMLIDGSIVMIGDTSVDLSNYATQTDVTTAKSEAATDATTKANKALTDAKAYADGLANNYATAAQGKKADTAVQSVKIGDTEYKVGTNVTLPEYTSVKGNAETAYRSGQVNITPANIGLENVNNTADSVKNVLSATKLTTARTIALSGAATGTATNFDGSANISIPVTNLDAAKLTLNSSDTLILNGGGAS